MDDHDELMPVRTRKIRQRQTRRRIRWKDGTRSTTTFMTITATFPFGSRLHALLSDKERRFMWQHAQFSY